MRQAVCGLPIGRLAGRLDQPQRGSPAVSTNLLHEATTQRRGTVAGNVQAREAGRQPHIRLHRQRCTRQVQAAQRGQPVHRAGQHEAAIGSLALAGLRSSRARDAQPGQAGQRGRPAAEPERHALQLKVQD